DSKACPPRERNAPILIDFYRTQLRLALRWSGGRGSLARRAVATCAVSLLSLLVTAWIIPGIRVRDVPSALVAMLVLTAMRTLLRPVLIAYLSEVSIIFATLVTVLAQAAILGLLARAGALAVDGVTDAVIGSVVFSVTNSLLTAVLSTGDDNSFFGTLVRQLAARHRKAAGTEEPGIVFIQIDGLSHGILERQMAAGRAPTLARWLR